MEREGLVLGISFKEVGGFAKMSNISHLPELPAPKFQHIALWAAAAAARPQFCLQSAVFPNLVSTPEP